MEIDGNVSNSEFWNKIKINILIGKQVKITLMDGSIREGIVYTVDIINRNFFLVQVLYFILIILF